MFKVTYLTAEFELKTLVEGELDMKKKVSVGLILFVLVMTMISSLKSQVFYADTQQSFVDYHGQLKVQGRYIVYSFSLLVYMLLTIILNSRHLKWVELRKKLLSFFTLLVIFSGLNFLLDYFFRPTNINYFREISIAFATALGI